MHQANTNSHPGQGLYDTGDTGRWVGVLDYAPLSARDDASGSNSPAGPGKEGPDLASGPTLICFSTILTENVDNIVKGGKT